MRAHARAAHLLAAVDYQSGFVLGQLRVDAKTNEHKAALESLPVLVLVEGAMFCQRESASRSSIRGDYFLQVKDN